MSAEEFEWWIAYAELEPFGQRQENRRTALIAQSIYNAAPFIKKARVPSIQSLLEVIDPEAKNEKTQQSGEELLAGFAKAAKRDVKRRGNPITTSRRARNGRGRPEQGSSAGPE